MLIVSMASNWDNGLTVAILLPSRYLRLSNFSCTFLKTVNLQRYLSIFPHVT